MESKMHPDLKSIEEDKQEDRNLIDKPYTCFFNPLLPSIGISLSGMTVGFIDQTVWITFFALLFFIMISYFLYVIPMKFKEEALKKDKTSKSNKRKYSD
jgi:Ca2+-dependent lipid-binding protein